MNKNPKIFHLITGLHIGGTEKVLLSRLRKLNDFNHIVCTVIPGGDIKQKIKSLGINVVSLEYKNLFSIFKTIKKLYILFKKETPNILATYLIHASLLGRIIGKICGVKKIVCFKVGKFYEKKYLMPFEFATSFLVDKYICYSEAIKDFYIKKLKISPKKIIVIPKGIEIKKYNKNIKTHYLYKQLKLDQNDIVISSVGRLIKRKGYKYLIEALNNALGLYPRCKVLFIGRGGNNKFQKLVKNVSLSTQNKIQYLGERKDIISILKITDIFILPTLSEGVSQALLEAMTAKCAVITTNIPENREVIKNNINGILVPPKNIKTLRKKILLLADSKKLRMKLGNNAFKTIKQDFNIEKTVKKLENFFKKITIN